LGINNDVQAWWRASHPLLENTKAAEEKERRGEEEKRALGPI